MVDLNRVILIGRLTRDAELKYTSGGLAISSFAIAVNRRKKTQDQWVDEANFFDVSVFGKSAETLNQYLIKGKMVAVDGELRQDRWEQDGQTRSKVVIVANNVQLLGGNGGNSSNAGGYSQNNSYGNYNNNAPRQSSYQERPAASEPDYDTEGFPNDIPF